MAAKAVEALQRGVTGSCPDNAAAAQARLAAVRRQAEAAPEVRPRPGRCGPPTNPIVASIETCLSSGGR